METLNAALAVLNGARLAGSPFDLVLADSPMSDRVDQVRPDEANHGPEPKIKKILMYSATGPRYSPQQMRSLGIAACIAKPIKPTELMRALLIATNHTPDTEGHAGLIGPDSRPDHWRSLQILIVEDHPFNQRVASLILEKRGHRVVIAANGREAVAAIERAQFDVALMDVQMPAMDGLEATKAIRAMEKANGRHLPIIAMTAQADRINRQSCLNAGMDGFRSKPVQADTLIHAVEDVGLCNAPAARIGVGETDFSQVQFNLRGALERVNGNRAFFNEMTGIFLKERCGLMSRIRDGIAGGDLRRAGTAAHTLKNWASGFIAPQVHRAAELIEQQLDSGAIENAQNSYGPLEQSLDQLAAELDQISRLVVA